MPTFLFHLHRRVGRKNSFFISICLWRWNRQSIPKRRHIKFKLRRITQKKVYNVQNTAIVSNHDSILLLLSVMAYVVKEAHKNIHSAVDYVIINGISDYIICCLIIQNKLSTFTPILCVSSSQWDVSSKDTWLVGEVIQKNQLDAAIIYWSIRSAQHVSGNILPIIRSVRLRYLQHMVSCCCGGQGVGERQRGT